LLFRAGKRCQSTVTRWPVVGNELPFEVQCHGFSLISQEMCA